MNSQILEKRMDRLNERLRILILQNARENSFYDEGFLKELRELADQILKVKTVLGGLGMAVPEHFQRRLVPF